MSGFIKGENRDQSTLFPEAIDDYVEEDSVVRVVGVFIDRLDIFGAGNGTVLADSSQPCFCPCTENNADQMHESIPQTDHIITGAPVLCRLLDD